MDYPVDDEHADILHAVQALGVEEASIRLPELWDETIIYVCTPGFGEPLCCGGRLAQAR